MIIMLNGYSGVGKDTVAEYLASKHGYSRYAIADPLREMLEMINPIVDVDRRSGDAIHLADALADGGWDRAKRGCSEVRRLLEATGQAARDALGKYVWMYALEHRTSRDSIRLGSRNSDVVVSDVRYENEFQWLGNDAYDLNGGEALVRVERPGIGPVSDHVSAGVLSYPDYTIVNDGSLDDLYAKVDALVEELS